MDKNMSQRQKTKERIDLENATFIVPLRLDSEDRLVNLKLTTKYLLDNFNTNIIILEADTSPKAEEIIDKKIEYIFYKDNNDFFHRTKFLNIMLDKVRTKCVINYDIDVVLPLEAYKLAYELINNDQADLVYPFEYGRLQHEIDLSGKEKFKKNFSFEELSDEDFSIRNHLSEVGHCQFFNRDVYIRYGMENEDFISYGPEDKERFERFIKFGKRIHFISKSPVYHLKHYRGKDSSEKNFYFQQNWLLYQYLRGLDKQELENYYARANYKQKYNTN